MMKNENSGGKYLAGCCGLYCGLCTKFQSKAKSRCVGCKHGEQHSWCSIWNCCVKKRGCETCAECPDIFRCDILTRRKVHEWVPAAENLRFIKENGLKLWLKGQEERQALAEKLLKDYNEGRSMRFYCYACTLMPTDLIHKAIEESEILMNQEKVDKSDLKEKAKLVKTTIKELASKKGIDLSYPS